MEVNLDTNVQKLSTLAAAAASGEPVPAETAPAAVLGGVSVKVTKAPEDLDKLVAELKSENSDLRAKLAKERIGNSFEAMAALMEGITESQTANLNQMSKLSKELEDALSSMNTKQTELDNAKTDLVALQVKIDELTAAVERWKVTPEEREAKLEEERVQGEISEGEERVEESDNLEKAQAELDKALAEKTALESNIAKLTKDVSDLDKKATDLETAINACANALDSSVLRTLVDALKITASDVVNISEDREEDSEKKKEIVLGVRTPAEIISDALAERDREFLDEVTTNRTQQV